MNHKFLYLVSLFASTMLFVSCGKNNQNVTAPPVQNAAVTPPPNNQSIIQGIGKIKVRLDRLMKEDGGFTGSDTDKEAEQKENSLRSTANSVRSDIGDIVVELKAAGFDRGDVLDNYLNKFFELYEEKIHLDYGVMWESGHSDYSQKYSVKRVENDEELKMVIQYIMKLEN